jgi:thiosulfate reductase cytochrome b subunit
VRLTHWVVALALLILVPSGLQIFNAHPALYWGNTSRFGHSFLEIGSQNNQRGRRGFVRIGSTRLDTTGVLGLARDGSGRLQAKAFPHWAVLPSYQDLASGRRWHFFAAWVLLLAIGAYVVANFLNGRFRKELLPTRDHMRGIGRSILDHLRLRLAHGEEAAHYNVLQRLAYLVVMYAVIPLTIVTGLALSPAIDATFPWLPYVLGGRQTSRSLHFFSTVVIVLFFVIHIGMIIAAGPINEMRSIITGWYTVRTAPGPKTARKVDEP